LSLSRVFKSAILLIGLSTIAFFVFEYVVNKAVVHFLTYKIPELVSVKYDSFTVDSVEGSVSFSKMHITSTDRRLGQERVKTEIRMLNLSGLSYWQLLIERKVYFRKIAIITPVSTYKNLERVRVENNSSIHLKKPIFVEELVIEDAKLQVLNIVSDTTFSVRNVQMVLHDLQIDKNIVNTRIPFKLKDYKIVADTVFCQSGKFENLHIAQVLAENKMGVASKIRYGTKLTRKELSNVIQVERDHINLTIEKATFNNFDLSAVADSVSIAGDSIDLSGIHLALYRDKALKDNSSIKPMLSSILKDIPVGLNIKKVNITDGAVVYEEDLQNNRPPGLLYFNNVHGGILAINNEHEVHDDMSFSLSSKLMGVGRLKLNCNFNSKDGGGGFTAEGQLQDFDMLHLNGFLNPNASVKTKGTIDNLYFTINGRKTHATGAVKMRYQNLEFVVLKKNRLGINKLVTFLGNLFINDGSDGDEKGYRHGTINVDKPQGKSFFGYVWAALQDGILSVLSGNGEKNTI